MLEFITDAGTALPAATIIVARAATRRISYLRAELNRSDVRTVPVLHQELQLELDALLEDPNGPRVVR